MLDSLVRLFLAAMQCARNGLPERYALVTLHRPSNVDDGASLRRLLISERLNRPRCGAMYTLAFRR
jgi:hypothetical protein